MSNKPLVAVTMGDPCGIGPEIIVKALSQDEVKKAANEFLSLNKPLDILLNNAGIMNRERKETADGFEEVFSVNPDTESLL